MPTYEYICRACGHGFEQFQKMSDPAVETCPKCSESAVQRLISTGGGIVFKGSGFYATDYRKGGPSGGESGKESGADKSGSGDGDSGKSGSSGESKDSGSTKDSGSAKESS